VKTPGQVPGTDDVGALVIGGDYQGLGIARSLGRQGVPVCIVDDEYSIARFSRHTKHSVRVKALKDEQETVRTLLEVGQRLGLEGWVLYPTRDETVATLSRHRDALAEFFRVPTPPWDVVRWAWDKRNTYRKAEELGIPAPQTFYPRTLEELREIDADFPLVLKPAIKEHFFYATKDKAWRADNREALERLFLKATEIVEEGGEVMIQELIPGDGRDQFAYCAFFKDGKAVGQMVARRDRQHPPDFGRSSTFVETTEMPEVEELSERFLKAIDYYGLVELEYKRDAKGRFRLLDVNARTWGYHSIGARSGVDFPAMLFDDQLGRSVTTVRARSGIRWVRLTTDVPTAAVMLYQRRLSWRSYLRSLRGVDVEGSFAKDDFVPGLVELALIPYLAIKRGF
jgi:predicted ATP-grasp superfamily ATP-dependent carboligase